MIIYQKEKEIFDKIVEKEKQEKGLSFNFEYTGKIQYLKDILSIKSIKLYRDRNYLIGGFDFLKKILCEVKTIYKIMKLASAFYSQDTSKIIIFDVNDYKDNQINTLVKICTIYHEMRHEYQMSKILGNAINNEAIMDPYVDFDITNYSNFIIQMEQLVMNSNNYYNDYNNLYFELDAKTYGTKCTMKYMEENGITLDENKNVIKYFFVMFQQRKENYNFNYLFTKFNNIVKIHPEYADGLQIFYDYDGNLKSVDQIIQNEHIKEIDINLLVNILTSKPYVDRIKFENMSNEAKMYMAKIMEYFHENNKKRRDNNKKTIIEIDENILKKKIKKSKKKLKIVKPDNKKTNYLSLDELEAYVDSKVMPNLNMEETFDKKLK